MTNLRHAVPQWHRAGQPSLLLNAIVSHPDVDEVAGIHNMLSLTFCVLQTAPSDSAVGTIPRQVQAIGD